MIRKGIRPGFRISHDLIRDSGVWRRILPFRRSWIAIGILAVMDAVFLIPAVGTFAQAVKEWRQFDSLFDLVGALFLSAWLLGWMIGPILMTSVLALMLFGREVIRVQPGIVEIFIGVPAVGVATLYDVTRMRNLRVEKPPPKSGTSWRGNHFVFDYGANPVRVGSAVGSEEAAELRTRIQMVSGQAVSSGPAPAEDVETRWDPVKKMTGANAVGDFSGEGKPQTLTSLSSILLVLANLVPVAGTMFFGWKLSDVMVLYWTESAVIGFYNVCKIAVVGRWAALVAGPFFVGHFGGFMTVHFLFISSIFVAGAGSGMDSGGDLGKVAQLFFDLWPAIAALFVSHGYSFFANFIGRREYLGRTVKTQMTEPYTRIVFMHLVLIFGGGLTLFFGAPEPVLLIVIALKIYIDLKAHLKERKRRIPSPVQ